MKPLLSVCLITYNQQNYIEQAIESVLMQQVNFSWQLIIADDCSTDETGEIIKAYQNKFPARMVIDQRCLAYEQYQRQIPYLAHAHRLAPCRCGC